MSGIIKRTWLAICRLFSNMGLSDMGLPKLPKDGEYKPNFIARLRSVNNIIEYRYEDLFDNYDFIIKERISHIFLEIAIEKEYENLVKWVIQENPDKCKAVKFAIEGKHIDMLIYIMNKLTLEEKRKLSEKIHVIGYVDIIEYIDSLINGIHTVSVEPTDEVYILKQVMVT